MDKTLKNIKKNPGKTHHGKKKHISPASVTHPDRRIPHGYDIDTIVIMPVNTDTSFIYWEITDRLLNDERKKLKRGSARLIIRVLEPDCLKEICSFDVKEMIGKNYINYQSSFRPLIAEIGIMNGKGFKGLLRSGNTSASSSNPSSNERSGRAGQDIIYQNAPHAPSEPGHETWMTRTGDICETIILPSSSGSAESIRLIEYYQKTMEQLNSVSSAEVNNFSL